MHSSRLRLSFRECRLRRGGAARQHRLHRAVARSDPRHGPQGPRQGADGEGRRAGGAGLSRRPADASLPQAQGLRDRLSRPDQGGGRGRRPWHAPGRQACRIRRRPRRRHPRGGIGVRRPAGAAREIHRIAAPYRNPGLRRWRRAGDSPQRARLFDPAPPSEGDRGIPGARNDHRVASRDGARGRR